MSPIARKHSLIAGMFIYVFCACLLFIIELTVQKKKYISIEINDELKLQIFCYDKSPPELKLAAGSGVEMILSIHICIVQRRLDWLLGQYSCHPDFLPQFFHLQHLIQQCSKSLTAPVCGFVMRSESLPVCMKEILAHCCSHRKVYATSISCISYWAMKCEDKHRYSRNRKDLIARIETQDNSWANPAGT